MVLGQPIVGGGLEKAAYLASAKIEVVASPFAVPRIIWVFVQFCSVELAQGVSVNGEVKCVS